MAQIKSIADQIACAGTTGANTGKLGCLSLFGTPTHLLALGRGKEYPGTTDFTTSFLEGEVQKGNIIPIIGASSFEDVSAEDSYSSNTSTVKRLNIKGLPEYRLMFEEGHEFYRQLAKLESFKSYSFIIGDDMGNWMMVKKANGNYAGFSAGHVTPELTNRKTPGGDAESKSLLIQFIDRLEWDKNYAILHQDKLGFVPTDVPTVNGVNLAYTSEPAAGSTVQVSAKLAADNNTTVEGLVVANFKAMVDDADNVITDVTESSPGVYDITLTTALTAGQTIKLYTYDSTASSRIIIAGSVLYKSEYAEAEVIA